MLLEELKDKVAIITGAGSGIGRALAKGFAEYGAKVVIVDISLDNALETKDIVERCGGTSIALKCDVSNEQDVINMVKETIKQFNTVDILINGAGIINKIRVPVIELSVEDWDNVMNVNLRGTLLLSKHVGRVLCEKRDGAIINISSVAGKSPRMKSAPYSTSKAAVIHLTKILALEMAEYNVRVNAVCPGSTLTPMFEGDKKRNNNTTLEESMAATIEGDFKQFRMGIPLKRVAELEDQVNATLFLATSMSRHITGQMLFVDGGATIG